MRRVKYLGADWPMRFGELTSRLRLSPFSDESGDGFAVDRVRANLIEGRFFEKIVVAETVLDPFGSEIAYERVSYRSVQFRFATSYPQIELIDPPRALKPFINKISLITDFTVAIDPLVISPLEWAEKLTVIAKKPIQVSSIEVSKLAFDKDTVARIVLSGKTNVLIAAERAIDGRSHFVERIQVRIEMGNVNYSLHLAADASIRSADSLSQSLLEDLRSTLPSQLEPRDL